MSIYSSFFPNIVRNSIIQRYLRLIVESHNDVLISGSVLPVVNEDTRRNQLVSYMKSKKNNFRLIGTIVSENSYHNPSFITIGRADITFYPSQYDDKGIVFECKLINRTVSKKKFNEVFFVEGLDRFKVKYPVPLDFCGIIIFCENNQHFAVNSHVLGAISSFYEDKSAEFKKNYIYKVDYLNVKDMYSIIV